MKSSAIVFDATLQTDEIGGGVIRSLARKADLHLSGDCLFDGQFEVATPVVHHQALAETDTAKQLRYRALLDGYGLRARCSDLDCHIRYRPESETGAMVYELIEQIRVEHLVPSEWPGMRSNLKDHYLQWVDQVIESGLAEADAGLLILTVSLMVWTRINSTPIPDKVGDWIESTRANLSGPLGEMLAGLRRTRLDQPAFAPINRQLSDWVAQALAELPSLQLKTKKPLIGRTALAFRLPHVKPSTPPTQAVDSLEARVRPKSNVRGYQVFTSQFDQTGSVTDWARSAELVSLREGMDEALKSGQFHLPRLIRRLRQWQLILALPSWESARPEGLLDLRLAHKLVTEVGQKDLFQHPCQLPTVETALTILLDCSGSMKQHANQISLFVDLLSRAAERAGLKIEVLGYTTASWAGGQALKAWYRRGQPKNPGRLAETRHIVFKAFDQPWRVARQSLAGLRKLDLYKEGVDGEALQWAAERLMAEAAQRRELLVIADGCPMETASQSHNDEGFLDQHLRAVAHNIQTKTPIQLRAIGLGLDLGVFFRDHMQLDLTGGLTEAKLQELIGWLTRRRQTRGR
ncbi:MAG: cobaltochelatase CobT-related protein [Burkholderiaceae bacterium]